MEFILHIYGKYLGFGKYFPSIQDTGKGKQDWGKWNKFGKYIWKIFGK